MAAYAALCSLMHIVEQLQRHPSPPISLDQQQVQSLTENVAFLQEFLEGYSGVGGYTKEADPLESRIADAAHAAEDLIESHIVDRIHASRDQKISIFNTNESFWGSREADDRAAQLYRSLWEVMEDMDSIKEEVAEIKGKTGVRDQQQRNSTRPPGPMEQNAMVGIEDAVLEILDKLTGGDSGLRVIPIVGMGGMGKTTLARNVYINPLVQQYFDVCAWITISQEYNTREILREILCPGNKEELGDIEEVGVKLHKYLSGRRYLIVLDDMWSIEAWDGIRRFFPGYNDGSRIVITTRLSNLTSQLTGSYSLEMQFLNEDKSWDLLSKTVFGEEGCPLELEDIGKKIARNCRGLPLSIVVTGGLLVKSKHSREYWEYIAKNLNSLVNSEDNERCLNILHLSYKQLPVFLKPCFLFMGVYPEDEMIRAKELIRLWVAEGFLKPASGKSLEEVAEELLEELVDRNLVRAWRHVGKIKRCSIHDLLRDLCLREAQKERFYYVRMEHSLNDSRGINTQRRIVIPKFKFGNEVDDELQSVFARSLMCDDAVVSWLLDFRLLRVLNASGTNKIYKFRGCLLENMFDFVNSRYLAINVNQSSTFPSSVCHLWNLQTLDVRLKASFAKSWDLKKLVERFLTAPSEIWMMPLLRHVKFVDGLYLPDPPRKDDDIIVLTNLQSLHSIVDFKCSEEVIKRIPNLKKLGIRYENDGGSSHYFVNNLDRFHKLESFNCSGADLLYELSFPYSLKRLTLSSSHAHWDDIMKKIGSLPLLEVLKLSYGSFKGCVWETVEGHFSNLKFLAIEWLESLEDWNSDSTHFPCLEQLVLKFLHDLKEIPSGIGEIPTLQSIELSHCSYSAAISARKILEQQEEFGDVALQVRVSHSDKKEREALESLATPNFQVRF